jgi:hypothetical protein
VIKKEKKSNVFFCKETTSIKEETRTVGFQPTAVKTEPRFNSNFILLTPLSKDLGSERETESERERERERKRERERERERERVVSH